MNRAVTFDFGQTLADLDSAMVAARVAERGVELDAERVDAETLAAWDAYNAAKRTGASGERVWKVLMRTLLTRAGAPRERIEELVGWLWSEQPRKNLWRRPIPGMFELACELREQGVAVGVLSNSEGRLAELIEELGWTEAFCTITDSGRLPFEKPDARIFHHTSAQLGVSTEALIHVGDAWEADVRGAVGVGARAVYFSPATAPENLPGVAVCHEVIEVRQALRNWDLPV